MQTRTAATPVTVRPPIAELIRGARAGDPDALGALYEAHGAALFRLAYRLMGSREDAEDVVHDVFVGLPEALGHYEERGNMAGWLRRVAARVALMRLRSHRRQREVALDRVEDAAGLSAVPLVDAASLQEALDTLPGPLRAVVVLNEIEGYTHAEIGELLGISAGASRARLLRALKRLRHALGRED